MAKLRYLQGNSGVRTSGFLNNTVRTVRGVYETDAEVARALLPQPLVGIERPEIYFQFAHVAMHVSPERTVEIGALTMGVHCTYEGQPGSYCFVMAMEGESVVTSGRERFGEPKKIAATTFEKNGDHVKATVTRHGITFWEIEGDIGAENANPRTFEEHLFCYKGLPSITTPGEFDGDVFLTRLDWKRDYTTRRDFTGQIKMRESVYDPLVDVPVRKMLSMEYVEGSTITSGTLMRKVPGEWISQHWVGRNDEPANTGLDLSAPTEKAA